MCIFVALAVESPALSLLSMSRAFADRLIRRQRLVILYAQRRKSDPGSATEAARAQTAMRHAGEPVGLVAERFAQDDKFIGWQIEDSVACFGWRSRLPIRF